MHYIGIDYHKRCSYLVVKDEKGKTEQRGNIANTREEYEHLLKPYRPGKAVLEATRNWGLIYDWLVEILDNVVLAHPLKVRATAEARIVYKPDPLVMEFVHSLNLKVIDDSRAREEWGWQPSYSDLEKVMKDFIQEVRTRPQSYGLT